MLCKNVLPLLSEFFDGVLDDETSVQVSQHLGQCIGCRKEFDSISALHKYLSSAERIPAPKYLHSLVQHRLCGEPLSARVRNELERWWSIVRTTEGMWYATRAVGTVAAFVFFLIISVATTPFYIQAGSAQRDQLTFEYGRQVNKNVSVIFGVRQFPAKNGRRDPAAINPKHLIRYADSISGSKEDNFSVVTVVDSTGTAKVESVLTSPTDESLLTKFQSMLADARLRPASENGQAVPAALILSFSRILVSD